MRYRCFLYDLPSGESATMPAIAIRSVLGKQACRWIYVDYPIPCRAAKSNFIFPLAEWPKSGLEGDFA